MPKEKVGMDEICVAKSAEKLSSLTRVAVCNESVLTAPWLAWCGNNVKSIHNSTATKGESGSKIHGFRLKQSIGY